MDKQSSRTKANNYDRPTQVFWAGISKEPPPFAERMPKGRGVRRQGVLYENKVQEHLLDRYSEGYIASPWFRYRDANQDEDLEGVSRR